MEYTLPRPPSCPTNRDHLKIRDGTAEQFVQRETSERGLYLLGQLEEVQVPRFLTWRPPVQLPVKDIPKFPASSGSMLTWNPQTLHSG